MTERDLVVIPAPKEIAWTESLPEFELNANTSILLLPDAPGETLLSAQLLQAEISQATGLRTDIVKMARPVRLSNAIVLVHDRESAAAFLRDDVPWGDALKGRGQQAHAVSIKPLTVVAGGQGNVALAYAVQTLRQIARAEGTRWPCRQVRDWPALPNRGIMLDVTRGRVPTMSTLKMLVDQMSLYKLNVLQLYTEHTFVFPHHPRIGEDCGSLSAEDMMELDSYARQRQVELIPNLNSFGHCAHVLAMPEYARLAESDVARWSLCPVDERVFEFLDDLYGDMLPAFSSEWFNIGCDETWDLGKGRSAETVAEKGLGRVYLEYLLRLRELAGRHGRRLQIWGDILLHHPELVPELPDDVLLLDWHYGAADDYPSVQVFAESGRDFWVCPGTSSWNTLFPRIENANVNIRTLARVGTENGAKGLLNTDWGDNGHYQPIGQSFYGYLFGAEQSWTGGVTSDADFDARFGELFFGPGGREVVDAIRRLGSLNVLPGMARPNASNSIYALLDEPLVGPMIDELPAETLQAIVTACAEVERDLRDTIANSRDAVSVDEMAFSARLMGYAARKVQASQRMRGDLAMLAKGDRGEKAAELLERNIKALRSLDAELVQLTAAFRETWLRRARQAEICVTLDHLQGVRERFALAQAWLEARLTELRAGQRVDYDLADYCQSAEAYQILGQAFWKRMQSVGIE